MVQQFKKKRNCECTSIIIIGNRAIKIEGYYLKELKETQKLGEKSCIAYNEYKIV